MSSHWSDVQGFALYVAVSVPAGFVCGLSGAGNQPRAPRSWRLASLAAAGGGVGSGPGLTIGAALALRDSERLTVGVLGDGDTLFSVNALWTAARYDIPALFIIANNRSYYNDELHQEGVARTRGRDPANRWIGQTIDGPAPDIAHLARAQGVDAAGPVTTLSALGQAMADGVAAIRAGRPFLIDVHIDPGHGRELTESMAERSLAKPG